MSTTVPSAAVRVYCFMLFAFVNLSFQRIQVPETLLKKRKQDNKAREDKLAKAAEARKVSLINFQ